MPTKKSKSSSKEKKIPDDVSHLIRLPLHQEKKENMKFFSSDDSPEKSPKSSSPVMSRESISASSTDSMQDIVSSPNLRNLQNQMNGFQETENSDEDMETEDLNIDNQSNLEDEYERVKLKGRICTNLRNRRPGQSKEKSQAEPPVKASNSNFWLYTILAILACIFLYYWLSQTGAPGRNDKFNATTLVNSLRAEFQNQPHLTFRIIHSALKRIQETQPEAPAIILLLSTNGSDNVCSKFAHRLVDSVSKYSLQIDGKEYKVTNANSAKMDIDNNIKNSLKFEELGSVLIEDLDQIPGRAAVMLHKYSDHENAPFKRAVFVMTVNYNKAISNNSCVKEWDKAANDHLLSVWTDIGVDQVIPLLSRLTVSVAVITA